MQENTEAENNHSFQRAWLLWFTVITSLIFSVSVIFLSHLAYKYIDDQILNDTENLGKFIANQLKIPVVENEPIQAKNQLESLAFFPLIQNAHVYSNASVSLENIASYNKKIGLKDGIAIPQKNKEELKALLDGKIAQNSLELAIPINNNKLLGYLYLVVDLKPAHSRINNFVFILSALALFTLLILLVLLTRVFVSIAQPLEKLGNRIVEISRMKDFSARCQPSAYLEIDWLTDKVNQLISRVEKHINKQTEAERQIISLNHKLEDKVNQRTEALKESNEELLRTLEKLHQYQGQLVESEKMASLGDMVAGVAHEVNTPIGLGVTASSLLADNLTEIQTAFEQKTLKSSQLKRFLHDGQENIGIISRNLKRAADLISSFKQVAVDQSSEESRQFKVKDLIDEVTLTLAPELKDLPYQLEIKCPSELEVYSKPGPLNQILMNLILNSIKHGFDSQDHGTITIEFMLLGKQLHISYQDNGRGVDEAIKDKIFDPFITTKRGSGGSGLGLHLVYNLVTQGLAGTIQFASELGKGVSFDINIPVN